MYTVTSEAAGGDRSYAEPIEFEGKCQNHFFAIQNNLIGEETYAKISDSLRQWIPIENKLPYVGDYQRILEYQDGKIIWQGKPIKLEDPIPGI
mgnify:CR=1 FL=1